MWEPSDSTSRVGSGGTGLDWWRICTVGPRKAVVNPDQLQALMDVPCCSVSSTLQSWNRVSFRAHQQHHAALNDGAVRFQVKLMQPRTERGHLPQLSLGCQRWLRHLASCACVCACA